MAVTGGSENGGCTSSDDERDPRMGRVGGCGKGEASVSGIE